MRDRHLPLVLVAAAGGCAAQSVLGPAIAVQGTSPDAPTIATLILALHLSPPAAFVGGWCVGMTRDLLGVAPPGSWALGQAIGALLATGLYRVMGHRSALAHALTAAAATGIAHAVFLLLLVVTSRDLPPYPVLLFPARAALYTALVAPFVVPLLAGGRCARPPRPLLERNTRSPDSSRRGHPLPPTPFPLPTGEAETDPVLVGAADPSDPCFDDAWS